MALKTGYKIWLLRYKDPGNTKAHTYQHVCGGLLININQPLNDYLAFSLS